MCFLVSVIVAEHYYCGGGPTIYMELSIAGDFSWEWDEVTGPKRPLSLEKCVRTNLLQRISRRKKKSQIWLRNEKQFSTA